MLERDRADAPPVEATLDELRELFLEGHMRREGVGLLIERCRTECGVASGESLRR